MKRISWRIPTAAAPSSHGRQPLPAAIGASVASAFQCAGLQELLDGCGLGGSYAAALAWCEEQGYESLAEVVETGEQDVFVAALQLKPGKAKLLRGRIA